MNTPISRRVIVALFAILLVLPVSAQTEDFKSKFKDPETGEFDMSTWLAGRAGFFPVPIIITEPAVGYGGGLFLTFFHPKKDRAIDWELAVLRKIFRQRL